MRFHRTPAAGALFLTSLLTAFSGDARAQDAGGQDAGALVPGPVVRVNSVGYLPGRAKRAIVAASGGTTFNVLRAQDGSIAFSGTLTGPVSAATDSGGNVYEADFDSVAETGTFMVDVPSVGQSPPFAIAVDPYTSVLQTVMLGFYGWRCGTAVSLSYGGFNYAHAACHTHDASLALQDGGAPDAFAPDAGPGPFRDGTQGWHDAGDYGKYTVNGAFAAGMLLQAFEDFGDRLAPLHLAIPETCTSATPDFLSEIRFELEWLLKMAYGDGRIFEKLTSTAFDVFEMPEDDQLTRYYVPFGTKGTADFVAVLAKASRAFQPYDAAFAATLLQAATLSYTWLQANTAHVTSNETGFSTGSYESGGDAPDRAWAAAEMWETTGSAAALTDFETRVAATNYAVDSDFDWSNVRNLGTYTYLRSQRTGRSATAVSSLSTKLLAAAQTLLTARAASPYARTVSYYWGSNGSTARTCMLLHVADLLQPNSSYGDACLDALAYVFGRNQYGRSQVTDIGIDPPLHPHHRPSASDGIDAPWPGLLVGGGDKSSSWQDVQADYTVNEVAINWNAPLAYALAEQLPAPTDAGADAAPCVPWAGAIDGGAESGAPSVAGDASTAASDAASSVSEGDAGVGSSGPPASSGTKSGCGCVTAGRPDPAGGAPWLGVALALAFARRKRVPS